MVKRDRVGQIARLIFFVIAAFALAWTCREGVSLFEVGVVFVVYVAAATLWVRGQHEASVRAQQGGGRLEPWAVERWLPWLLLGVGIVVAVYGFASDDSIATLAGVLIGYLGSGYVLMRFRMYTNDAQRRRVLIAGAGVLIVVTLLVVVGLLLLEESGWAVVPLGSILLAPIGMSLLAEPAIRWLQEEGREGTIAIAAAAGLAALLIVIGIAVNAVGTEWVAFAFIALALLILAVVSNTQADIAIVAAAVALMGITPMSEGKPKALEPTAAQTRVLVALGDSYMSGEGADIFYTETAVDEQKPSENHCHRAPTAWAAMAGRTTRLFDSVAFTACSGARTYNVRHGRTPQYNEPGTQLDQIADLDEQLKVDLDPSLVVVSLGGNDAGFSTIGMMCLAPGDCIEKRDLWETNLENVASALSATYAEIRDEFPKAPVLVTAYPAPIYTESGQPVECEDVALSKEDMRFVSEFVPKLNGAVAQAAAANRFYFLAEMEDALEDANLQLCDPLNNKRPGINFIGLRSVGGIAEQRFNPKNWYHNSLHPNERGHAAMLQVFEQWRVMHPDDDDDPLERDAPPSGTATSTGSTGERPDPPCDLVKDAQSTKAQCDDAGAEWVRGQLRDLVIPWWGLGIAFATLGAWLVAVALFGWWKPWWPDRTG